MGQCSSAVEQPSNPRTAVAAPVDSKAPPPEPSAPYSGPPQTYRTFALSTAAKTADAAPLDTEAATNQLAELFAGALVGCAVGDAVGFYCEGNPASECARVMNTLSALLSASASKQPAPALTAAEVERALELSGASGTADAKSTAPRHFAFGQYSDDTQLTRELLLCIMGCNKPSTASASAEASATPSTDSKMQASATSAMAWDTTAFMQRISNLYKAHQIVGCGLGTAQALTRFLKGTAWQKSGAESGQAGMFTPVRVLFLISYFSLVCFADAGNSPAIRAAAIGLLFCLSSHDSLMQCAQEQATATHRDKRSVAGAVVMAVAVRQAVLWQPPLVDTTAFIKQLQEAVTPIHAEFAGYLTQLIAWLKLPPEQAVKHIERCGMEATFNDGTQGVSGFVISSVLWALYSFLHSPNDFWKVVVTAVSGGGDTDSCGALAACLAGAHNGLASVPKSLAQLITDQGQWGLQPLQRTGLEAAQLVMSKDHPHPAVALQTAALS